MDSSGQNLLSALPAELRNRIFELAVYHTAAPDGIISPVADNEELHNLAAEPPEEGDPTFKMIFEWQHPTGVNNIDLRPPEISHLMQVLRAQGTLLEYDHEFGCTLDCLVQPPLTRTNRQIREEALPIFYSNHTFIFDLQSNFCRQRAINDWWRAVGDTNLRSIRHMRFTCPTRINKHSEFSFEYMRPSGQAEGRLETGLLCDVEPYGSKNTVPRSMKLSDVSVDSLNELLGHHRYEVSVVYHAHELQAIAKSVEPFVVMIEQGGINVLALESYIGLLTRKRASFLRDFSALGENRERAAKMLAWKKQVDEIVAGQEADDEVQAANYGGVGSTEFGATAMAYSLAPASTEQDSTNLDLFSTKRQSTDTHCHRHHLQLMMGTALSARPDNSHAQLINLPGEIKNRIYRYAVVKSGAILLRVTEDTASESTKVITSHILITSANPDAVICRLLPGTPAPGQVCKEISNEVKSIYFRENIFTFTESTLNPQAVKAFRVMADESAKHIRNIKVSHTWCLFRKAPSVVAGYTFYVRLTVSQENAGVSLTYSEGSRMARRVTGGGNPGLQMCCCKIESLAVAVNKIGAKDSGNGSPLLGFLEQHASCYAATPQDNATWRQRNEGDDYHACLCDTCDGLKMVKMFDADYCPRCST